MEVPIIKIGTSKGILLSKTLLERYEFGEKVEIIMKHDHLELRPVEAPRVGWEDKFRLMHEEGMIKIPKTLTKKRYLEIEAKFAIHAKIMKMSIAELDLNMWFIKTGRVLK